MYALKKRFFLYATIFQKSIFSKNSYVFVQIFLYRFYIEFQIENFGTYPCHSNRGQNIHTLLFFYGSPPSAHPMNFRVQRWDPNAASSMAQRQLVNSATIFETLCKLGLNFLCLSFSEREREREKVRESEGRACHTPTTKRYPKTQWTTVCVQCLPKLPAFCKNT